MESSDVICPTCFESFSVPVPPLSEAPCEVDYDCEVCCRPMLIRFTIENGEVIAHALGIHE